MMALFLFNPASRTQRDSRPRCIPLMVLLLSLTATLVGSRPAFAQSAPTIETIQKIIAINAPESNVKAEINAHVIRVEGTMFDDASKQRLIDTLTALPGVTHLVDHIQLNSPGPFSWTPLQFEAKLFWANSLQYLPAIGLGLLVFLALFWLSNPIARFSIRPLGWVTQSELIRLVMQRSISLLIILLGLYIFLRLAGLTQFAVAIISSTGVIGLILGFAFRDIAENFISSLLLSVQRPFKLGDVISVEGHLGVVKKVTARATTLVDYDGNHIQIPNATIYKNVIKNLTANPRTRGHFVIGIGYDASVTSAQAIALEIMTGHHGVLTEPEPQVLVDNLGASTINLQVYFWVNTQTHSVTKVASLLMRLLVRAFEAHQISMPDDARERIFPQGIQLISSEQQQLGAQGTPPQEIKQARESLAETHDEASDDISSDTDDIRQQAAESRDPENGANII